MNKLLNNLVSRRLFLSCSTVGAALIAAKPAAAWQVEALPIAQPGSVPERAGVVPWRLLQQAQFHDFTKPATVVPEVAALHGTPVTLEGYALPIEEGDKVTHFALLGYNAHCPYCSPGGMGAVVTVEMAEPVALPASSLLTLEGRFELETADLSGFIYYLSAAKLA